MVYHQPGDFPSLRLILRRSLHETAGLHFLHLRHLVFAVHDHGDDGDGVVDDHLFAIPPDHPLDCRQNEDLYLIR